MTRRFVSVVDDWTQPEEIWDYYERSIEALVALKSALDSGTASSGTSLFSGMTLHEADGCLREMRSELDRQVSFALVASFEAILRVDFWGRVHGRFKVGPGAEFIALAREYEERVRIRDILDIWNKHSTPAGRAGSFKEVLKIRDWLGHGRYWVPKTKHKPDPLALWLETARVFEALDGVPPLPTR